MINDEIYPMNRKTIFYKCDPSMNANCSKTTCQKECKFTTNAEFSGDGKNINSTILHGNLRRLRMKLQLLDDLIKSMQSTNADQVKHIYEIEKDSEKFIYEISLKRKKEGCEEDDSN